MKAVTQLQRARMGEITPEIHLVAEKEQRDPETLREYVAEGSIVIPANINHLKKKLIPIGIGKDLSTKINANIGMSAHSQEIEKELEKVEICEKYGADAVMDLSTDGDIFGYRDAMINKTSLPVGTVPLYQIVVEHGMEDFTPKNCLEIIEQHAKQGVDFMTIHAGFKKDFLPLVEKRFMGTVSRGGGILKKWMLAHKKENPLLQIFDEIIEIFLQYDVTFSLGDSLRPGALCDANDEAQIAELRYLGELTERALKKGVQVMIEGPGHVPIHMIEEQVKLEKKYCHGVPFYVLGPLTIDTGVGYDHITGAIGGAVAASHGADMLCYVTPSEHLSLPSLEDVREGIIAFKIAARSGDIAKKIPGSWEREKEMSLYRKNLNWSKQYEMSMDKEKFQEYRFNKGFKGAACSMCGDQFCPMRGEK